jgi:hypothetical protein
MGHCVQSAVANAACRMCGGRAEKMHQPVFHSGSFCPRCCPVCGSKAAATRAQPLAVATLRGVVAAATVKRAERQPSAQGATQWKDAGWGHHPDDPWYHDRDRYQSRPRWVPSRPRWFR